MEKIEKLKMLYSTHTQKDIARQLGMSLTWVRNKAISLGLKRSGYFWTNYEINILTRNYQKVGPTAIAERLGRTRWACINKYREVSGLRKNIRRK